MFLDLEEVMKVLKSKKWVLACLGAPNKAFIDWNKTTCKMFIYGTQIHKVFAIFVLSIATVREVS